MSADSSSMKANPKAGEDMSADSSSMKANPKAGEALIVNDEEVRIVMLGKTGAGKSATGNTILGHKAFISKFSCISLTKECQTASGVVAGRNVSVIDTPGLFDTELTIDETLREIKRCIRLAAPGPHVFLTVIELGRFTKETQKSVEMIQNLFGTNKYTMILFTHGDNDELEDVPVEEIVRKSPKLQEFVSKCEGRYHVFNNKTKDLSQVTELLEKINSMVLKNRGSHYTTEMFQEAERATEEEKQRIPKEKISKKEQELKTTLEEAINTMKEQHEREARVITAAGCAMGTLNVNDEEVRIVLLGKTGNGRSASGNTILGHKAFESKFSGTSLTKYCQKARGVVAGRNVSVIDTPGWFDTELTTDETLRDIKTNISIICLSAPGPHVFLNVIKLGRFTKEHEESVEMIQKLFGTMSNKYTMILFTNVDQLEDETVEEVLQFTPKLQELVSKCEGRYHVFNNKTKDPSQVTELLEKINNMVLKNGGSYTYNNAMFQAAERAMEEEKQRILKENEEKRRKEEKELTKSCVLS